MNRIALAMLAAVSLAGFVSHASEATGTAPVLTVGDEKAVRAIVDEFANAWNRHDMKAMHELDTDDVEWVTVIGHYWRGKTTVFKGHTSLHKVLAAKQSMSVESATIRSIAPTVAVAVATMHFEPLQGPDGQAMGPPAKTRGSFTTVKREGIWKIVHFQNTEIDPRLENEDLPNWGEAGLPTGK